LGTGASQKSLEWLRECRTKVKKEPKRIQKGKKHREAGKDSVDEEPLYRKQKSQIHQSIGHREGAANVERATISMESYQSFHYEDPSPMQGGRDAWVRR